MSGTTAADSRTAGAATGSLARGGALSLVGFVVAAAAGFLLTVVVARGLGPSGAGTFFTLVGVVTIGSTVVRLGADTGLVWALPRAAALGRRAEAAATVRTAVVPVVALGVLGALGVLAAAPVLAPLVGDGDPASVDVLRLGAPALLLAGVLAVLVGGLRGSGGVGAYTLLQNVVLPGLRCLLVLGGVVVGVGVGGVVVLWSVPLVVVCAAAGLLLSRRVRREGRAGGAARPLPAVARDFWGFALPRSASAVLEVVLVWSDVLLVAALTSPAEAGVYAAASRFVTTGTMVEAAARVAVAPRVSRLLAVGDLVEASRLHSQTTTWVVALSWPIYLVLGLGGAFALSLFGPGFVDGATALAVLCVAMLGAMLTGNSQTMLLMSGRSSWQLGNRVLAVVLNLSLLLVLVPRYGYLGAALAWGTTILVDSVIVYLEVRWLVGLRTEPRPVLVAVAAAVLCFGLPFLCARVVDPGGAFGFLLALLLSGASYAIIGLRLWRSRTTGSLRGDVRRVLGRGSGVTPEERQAP